MTQDKKHTPTPDFIWCAACKIKIEPQEDEGNFHVYPDHDGASGHHPETGECMNCPVPVQCGPLSYFVRKDSHDELLEAAKVVLEKLNAISYIAKLNPDWLDNFKQAIQKAEEK